MVTSALRTWLARVRFGASAVRHVRCFAVVLASLRGVVKRFHAGRGMESSGGRGVSYVTVARRFSGDLFAGDVVGGFDCEENLPVMVILPVWVSTVEIFASGFDSGLCT
jgi:hypothetical protein